MSRNSIVLIGGGGHAKVVIDTVRAAGKVDICGVLDDDPARIGATILGVPILGSIDETSIARFGITHAVIAIGNNRARRDIARRFEALLTWESIVHPRAIVSADAQVGDGAVIVAGAVLQPSVTVGRHVIVNTSASVDHDSVVRDFAHLAPGSHLAGGVTIGEGALIGMGASVLPACTVGDWATIGAGGVVIRDIPHHVIAVGVPATHEIP